jgi:hypothetical protein
MLGAVEDTLRLRIIDAGLKAIAGRRKEAAVDAGLVCPSGGLPIDERPVEKHLRT